MNTVLIAFKIMGIGMAGIFTAMLTILLITVLLKKWDKAFPSTPS